MLNTLFTRAALALPLALAAAVPAGAATEGANGSAFSVLPTQAVSAIVAVPHPEDARALYRGNGPTDTLQAVDNWHSSPAGLLVHGEPSPQAWFRVRYEDGSELTAGPRYVPGLEARNVRDLGGYQTTTGQWVKAGLLYRSGFLSHLPQQKQAQLESLGIQHICDLRSTAERQEKPDPDLNWQSIEGCASNASEASMASFAAAIQTLQQGGDVDWEQLITQGYSAMPTQYAEPLKALYASLLENPGEPALFHCTAGKDRTGVAAALLLLMLGVDEQTVIDDYTMSEIALQFQGDSIKSKAYPRELLEQPALRATNASYIQATLDSIRAQYGTLERYYDEVLGLDEAKIALLRKHYLRGS
ncbi:tyrosine-protein phosphatase [Parahaliea mediterranea]|uniref:tyrosine-protein phosphatase n=1 Tax=Parahaliea mediterranea TaxID=651086 RepID=UPI000E2FDD89|nr:tyrosine-protein phosphatase [Parahaliea mediterranea]